MLNRRTMGLSVAILLLAVGSTPHARPDDSGTGRIYCLLQFAVVGMPCDAELRGADNMTIATGVVESATVTIEWQAETPAAERLQLGLEGNPGCTSAEVCSIASVVGESPLSVTLHGDGASEHALLATVSLAPVCTTHRLLGLPENPPDLDRIRCDTPPFKLVMDQEFRYAWTIVE